MSGRPRVAVIQFPGVNCEWETAEVLTAVGLDGDVVRWNAPAESFRDVAAYVIPGGFSYQDRVRGGAIAAREPIVDRLVSAAGDGVPILGICNGALVLVEAGLVGPGVDGDPRVRMALARNRMPDRTGYYANWVTLEVTDAPSVFTTGIEPGTALPMPMAHGEGCFVSSDADVTAALESGTAVPMRYVAADGGPAAGFPDNPNGATGDAAAVSGFDGRVLALMPHPERAAWLWQVPGSWPGEWGTRRREWGAGRDRGTGVVATAGPGLELFRALARHLRGES